MPLHYILDGYNILKQASGLGKRKLKGGRNDFIRMLEESSCLKKQKVSLVFDGYPELEAPRLKFREGFEVLFSRNISADDRIKTMVEGSDFAPKMVIVSDDRVIRFFTKSLGANVMSVVDFFSWLFKKEGASNPEKESLSEDKNLGYRQTIEINRELRKRWLGE